MTTAEADRGAPCDVRVLSQQLTELADALVATNDQLLALYQLAKFSAASLEGTVAATRTLTEAQSIVGARSVAFVQRLDDGSLEPIASVGGSCADLLQAASTSGLGELPRIAHVGLGEGTVLSSPVQAHGQVFGSIIASAGPGKAFTTGDLKLVDALGSHLAVVLEMSAMHQDLVHQAVVQRDHDTASALARAALNRSLPQVSNVDIAATSNPARSAGGDFYAAGPSASGMFMALGDVSGKGLPAALVMTSAISAMYSAFSRSPGGNTAAVLGDFETQLDDYLTETGMFITMAVAHIDSTTGALRITNAGQSPVIIVREGVVQTIHTSGPPIGVLPPRQHCSEEWPLSDGDLLFIGSDGCTDQRNPTDEMFGEGRLHALLELNSSLDARDLIAEVFDRVNSFGSGMEQDDDLTAIAARLCRGERHQ